MKQVIDAETGEIKEVEDNYDLVAKEINPLITDDFLQQLEDIATLEQQISIWKSTHKEQIKEAFKKYNIKSFKNDYVSISYVGEHMSQRVDVEALKNDGLYDKYTKLVPNKESLRIQLKGRND